MKLRTLLSQVHPRSSLLSLIVIVSILLALLIIPSWQKFQSDTFAEQVSHRNNIISFINELEVALQDMRASTRGYIITANPIFSAQFEQARDRQLVAMDGLQQEITFSTDLQNGTRVAELHAMIEEWYSNRLVSQIAMVERGERIAAENDFLLGISTQSYERIRSLMNEIRTNIKAERRELVEDAAALRARSTIVNQVLVVIALLGVGIVVVGFNRLGEAVQALQSSEKAAQHLSEELVMQLNQVNIQNNRLAQAQRLATKSTTQPHASRIDYLVNQLADELSLDLVVLHMSVAGVDSFYSYHDAVNHPELTEFANNPKLLSTNAQLQMFKSYGMTLHQTILSVGSRVIGTLFVVARHEYEFDPLVQQQFTLLIENYYLFEQISQQQNRLKMVVDAVPIGLLLIDSSGRILVLNKKARELLPASHVGLPIEPVLAVQQFYISGGRSIEAQQVPILQVLNGADVQTTEIVHEIGEIRIPVRHEVVAIQHNSQRQAFVVILEDVRQQYELDRLKSDFVSMISHELRTPLAAIVGATSMLVTQQSQGREQVGEVIKLINTQGQRLQKLIEDVLNVSRIDRDGVRLQRERIDPQLLVRRVIDRQSTWSSRTRIHIHTELPDVYVDVLRIEQVIENLLDNAVKYAPNSDIEVGLRFDSVRKSVVVTVRDFGVPLSVEERRRVFERFYQAHSNTNDGVGLGLAICKYFVEAHGGEIAMDAVDDNAGTVVTFTMPLSDQVETIPLVKHGTTVRVLVVDDDPSIQRTIQAMLQDLEYHMVVVGSVREAYESLDRMYFDLMIVDVMLPDQSGLDFVRDIRAWLSIPIMMVTARNSEKDVIAGLRAGVDDYMIKPFSYDELALRLMNLLRRQYDQSHDDPSLTIGNIQLFLNTRQVKVKDEILDLTPIEHRLFVVFVRNIGQVLPHERLLHAVWGDRYEQENQYLWVHISHLRRKLSNALVTELQIENVRGIGYKMQLIESDTAPV